MGAKPNDEDDWDLEDGEEGKKDVPVKAKEGSEGAKVAPLVEVSGVGGETPKGALNFHQAAASEVESAYGAA